MSESESESNEENTQDILEESKEKKEAIEVNNNMEKDLLLSNITKEQHSVEIKKKKKKKKKKEEEPQLPVSDSPQSVPFHSSGGSFAATDHEVPNAVANRIVHHEVEHHYKVEEGLVSGGNSGFLMSKKEAKLIKALLWIRIIALVLCLISFAVMADDRKGMFQELSFYDVKEFMYVFSVNVIGFIYCAVQIWDLLNCMFTKKHLVNHKWVRYFSFAMDQVLAYLLLSASASAATMSRFFSNITEFVGDEFITKAYASIAMSSLAFMAFALATLVSAYMLFKFN